MVHWESLTDREKLWRTRWLGNGLCISSHTELNIQLFWLPWFLSFVTECSNRQKNPKNNSSWTPAHLSSRLCMLTIRCNLLHWIYCPPTYNIYSIILKRMHSWRHSSQQLGDGLWYIPCALWGRRVKLPPSVMLACHAVIQASRKMYMETRACEHCREEMETLWPVFCCVFLFWFFDLFFFFTALILLWQPGVKCSESYWWAHAFGFWS